MTDKELSDLQDYFRNLANKLKRIGSGYEAMLKIRERAEAQEKEDAKWKSDL